MENTIKSWLDFGIDIGTNVGNFKMLCPRCSHLRKRNPNELCLSVNTEMYGGVFNCHNCGWKGRLDSSTYSQTETFSWSERKEWKKPTYNPDDWKLNSEVVKWFKKRGISKETLEANMIGSGEVTYDRGSSYVMSASYPFIKNGEIVNIQFRSIEDKKFLMIKGAEKPFYGFQHIVENGELATNKIIIVEGMNDKLALYEAGFRYVISVPNGSPFEAEGEKPRTPNLSFLDDVDFVEIIKKVEEIIFLTDTDHQGRRLRDEIALRVGRSKCKITSYPEGCKDINDVLFRYGTEKVIEVVESATSFPITGIITVDKIEEELLDLYETGIERGWSTGVENLDEIFSIKAGTLSITTGVPSVGKSTAWNNFGVSLAKEYGIHTAYFSPESRPTKLHASKLAQLYLRKGFDKNASNRMTKEELIEAMRWVNKYFSWILPEKDKFTYKEIFQLFREEILSNNMKLGVIDPYASLINDSGKSEHEFIKEFLSECINFVDETQTHIAIVAHPTKLEIVKGKNSYDTGEWTVPTAYNISGSAHWFNKADFIISLWKSNKSKFDRQIPMEIHIQKSKHKEIATANEFALIEYDIETELYLPYYGSRRKYIEHYEEDEEYNLSHNLDEAVRQSGIDEDGEQLTRTFLKKFKTNN